MSITLQQVQHRTERSEEQNEELVQRCTALETQVRTMTKLIASSQESLSVERTRRAALEEELSEVDRDREEEKQSYKEDRSRWAADSSTLRRTQDVLRSKVQSEQHKNAVLIEEIQGLQRKSRRGQGD